MSGGPDPLYVRARTVLLDVVDALEVARHRRLTREDAGRTIIGTARRGETSAGPEPLDAQTRLGQGPGRGAAIDHEAAPGRDR